MNARGESRPGAVKNRTTVERKREALYAAGTGAADAMVEMFDQLDELLVALAESSGQ